MSRQLQGRILYPGASADPVAMAEDALRLDVSQAVRAARAQPSVYVSLSERVGIPLSLLRRAAPHVLVAHLLTSRQKRMIEQVTGFLQRTQLTLGLSRRRSATCKTRSASSHSGHASSGTRSIIGSTRRRPIRNRAIHPERGTRAARLRDADRGIARLAATVRHRAWEQLVTSVADSSGRARAHPDPRGLSYAELRGLYQGARVVWSRSIPRPTTPRAPTPSSRDVVRASRGGVRHPGPGRLRSGRTRRAAGVGRRSGGATRGHRGAVGGPRSDERLGMAGRTRSSVSATIEHFTGRVAESIASVV